MSFILDALKKSEIERQRQSIPGLVESGVARPRPRLPVWAIAVCVLLGINLLVLLAVLVRGWMTSPHAPEQQPRAEVARKTHAADEPRSERAPTTEEHGQDTPVYAPEIPVTTLAPPPAATQSSVIPPPAASTGGAGSSGAHLIRRRDPLLTGEDYKADDEEVLPSISEINLTGSQALPELHLDVHVFATRSSERFVFINMRKYHEGATLQEGPTVERIRRDGVILNYQGLRFLLPRQ